MSMSDRSSGFGAKNSGAPVVKEQLTAYQRWELASFDAPTIKSAPLSQPLLSAVDSAEQIAAEQQRVREQAQQEGYAVGHQTGYAEGLQQAKAETTLLHTLMENLQTAISQLDEQLAQSLLDLSLEIARKMVLESIKVNPEIILKIVSTAIGNLPHFNQNAHLIMHPQDAELVREQMGEQLAQAKWQIFTDEHVERGGCRVETAHSHVDATNQARWQHVVESIGQDKSWLA
ncbi:MAG: flagellar assembly protein FliH [Gallionella sp.]|nr:flagellar assembly protein FliH [Gallionella sp.]MDD4945711.1 flagellar assembly protein FliH [Gallionella sp.]